MVPPRLEWVVLGQLVGLPDLDYTFGACLFSRRSEGFVPNWDVIPFSIESSLPKHMQVKLVCSLIPVEPVAWCITIT